MTVAKRAAIAAAIALALVGAELFVVLSPGLSLPVLVRVALANMFLPPFALAARLGGSSGPSLVVVAIAGFLQWFLIAFLVLLAFGRRRRSRDT
jgi:hypothetical protein